MCESFIYHRDLLLLYEFSRIRDFELAARAEAAAKAEGSARSAALLARSSHSFSSLSSRSCRFRTALLRFLLGSPRSLRPVVFSTSLPCRQPSSSTIALAMPRILIASHCPITVISSRTVRTLALDFKSPLFSSTVIRYSTQVCGLSRTFSLTTPCKPKMHFIAGLC